jgi:regulator of protease activity HflC (stomatin/prohibitin superfamily)
MSFQLRSVDLPNPFETAIQDTEVRKQYIKNAEAERNKVEVEVDTLIKAAEYQKNVTINIAKGDAQSILQQNEAQVDSYNKTQTSQTNAYKALKEKLSLKNSDLLKMIKTQIIRDYDGNNMAIAIQSPEPAPLPSTK